MSFAKGHLTAKIDLGLLTLYFSYNIHLYLASKTKHVLLYEVNIEKDFSGRHITIHVVGIQNKMPGIKERYFVTISDPCLRINHVLKLQSHGCLTYTVRNAYT